MARRVLHRDLFDQRPVLQSTTTGVYNHSWMLTGTNAADAGVTVDADGGWSLTSASTSGDQIVVEPRSITGDSRIYGATWSSLKQSVMRWTFKATSLTDYRFECGWRSTRTAFDDTTDNNKIVLRSEDGGRLFVVTSNNGTDSVQDTGVTWDTDRIYEVEIAVRGRSTPYAEVRINGALVTTRAQSLLYSVDNTLGAPYLGIQTNTGLGKSVTLMDVDLQQLVN